MKKTILLSIIAVLFLAACKKEETVFNYFSATIRIKAEKITALNLEGADSIFIEVNGHEKFSFETFNDNCLNKSFGYNKQTKAKEYRQPFKIYTERELIKSGVLIFKTGGNDLIIK
jgi:hypothetical protein